MIIADVLSNRKYFTRNYYTYAQNCAQMPFASKFFGKNAVRFHAAENLPQACVKHSINCKVAARNVAFQPTKTYFTQAVNAFSAAKSAQNLTLFFER